MRNPAMTYSLADHDFDRAKSVGVFNVAKQLAENLTRSDFFKEFKILSNSSLRGKLRVPLHVDLQYHDEAIRSRVRRMLWDQWGVYDKAEKMGGGWLFLPKGYASFLRPSSFDLAVYIHDTMHEYYRRNFPEFISRLESRYFTEGLKNSLTYSKVIFTNSDFTKNELERYAILYNLRPPVVITAGIGFTGTGEYDEVKSNSLLLLTSTWPHKLTQRAIEFIKSWQKDTGFSGRVNIVGGLPSGVSVPQNSGWMHHLRLPEAGYRRLLAEAKALIFFSTYEGFGMPPVEAMAAGTCPVFSDIPATREVMGEKGFSFSNDSYVSFAQALNKALSVPRPQIRSWSEQLLEKHNWNKVVENIIRGLAQASR